MPYELDCSLSVWLELTWSPSCVRLQKIIDEQWLPRFKDKHVAAVAIRRGLLTHDHHTTSKGALCFAVCLQPVACSPSNL